MVDGKFLVETVFGAGTTRATGNDADVSKARSYLRTLLETSVSPEYVHYLDEETIRARFGRYVETEDGGTNRTAVC